MGVTSSIISASQAGGSGGAHSWEPYRVYNFELIIEGLPGNLTDKLSLGVEVAALPSVSNDKIELGYGNDFIYLQGKSRVEPLSITYRDFADPHISKILLNWYNSRHYESATGRQGLASDYKKVALLKQHLPDRDTGVKTWRLQGLWIEQANFGSLDNNSSDIVRVECTFSYDRAIPAYADLGFRG